MMVLVTLLMQLQGTMKIILGLSLDYPASHQAHLHGSGCLGWSLIRQQVGGI